MFNNLFVVFFNWILTLTVILLEDSNLIEVQLLPQGGQVSFTNVSPHRSSPAFEREMNLYLSMDAKSTALEKHASAMIHSHNQRASKLSTWLSEVFSPVANWIIGVLQRPTMDDSLTTADPWKLPEVYEKLIAEQPDLVRKVLRDPRLNILTRKKHIPPVYGYVPAAVILAQPQENGSVTDYQGYSNFSTASSYTVSLKAAPLYLEGNATSWQDEVAGVPDAEMFPAQESVFVSYIYEAENQYEKFLLYKKREEVVTDSRLIYFNTELADHKTQDGFQRRSGEIHSGDVETSQERLSRVCGKPQISRRYRRLVNGRPSAPGQWPWMAYVAESTNLLSRTWLTYHGCGGVLITEKFVATASHCWKHMKNDEFSTRLHVQLGTTEFYDPSNDKHHPDRYQVLRMYVHSGFDADSYKNDITLLELKNPVNFTYKVLPVCLPSPGQNFVGEMAIVVGWGQLNYETARVSRVQQYVDVPIISRDTCQRWYDISVQNVTVLPGHLCAGYSNGGKDACKGDSGGPLVVRDPHNRWVLAGTVSHGFGCAAPFKPGLYANVTHFLPWILNIVNRDNDLQSYEENAS